MASQINIFNRDCMEAMKEMPDKAFDLAITDPPYFQDYAKETFPGAKISTTGISRHRWESKNWEVPTEEYFTELRRVSKEQIIWGFNYYFIKNDFSGRIIWDKVNDDSSFSKCEIAFCSLHKRVEIYRFMWNGMLQGNMKNKEIRIHPTQKPCELYRWLLKNYASPQAKILDTHLGSASIAIACYDMGFDLTAYEIDKDYYDAAIKRLDNHKKQLTFI